MGVLTLDDDVVQIDADPEYDPLIFRGRDVAFGHPTLHRNRAGNRLDHICELDQKAVASRLYDPAFVFGDFGIDEFATMSPKPVQGAGLIKSHKAAVSGHIGGENGREPALDPLSSQCFLPGGDLVENSSRPFNPLVCAGPGPQSMPPNTRAMRAVIDPLSRPKLVPRWEEFSHSADEAGS